MNTYALFVECIFLYYKNVIWMKCKSISISAKSLDNSVILIIEDNGIGIKFKDISGFFVKSLLARMEAPSEKA